MTAAEATESFNAAQYAKAMLNILEDTSDEKLRLEQMQKAVLNILDDLGAEVDERTRLQERFRGFLESAPDAIVIVNAGGTFSLSVPQSG